MNALIKNAFRQPAILIFHIITGQITIAASIDGKGRLHFIIF